MPPRPNILVTGTPGTGKTSLCTQICERVPSLRHVNVGELVKERSLHAGRDAKLDTLMIDEASEDRIVDELEGAMSGAGGVVLEHHSVDFFPERWFDLVLVLRTDNTVLFDRLTKRCVVEGSGGMVGEREEPRGRKACLTTPAHTHYTPHNRAQRLRARKGGGKRRVRNHGGCGGGGAAVVSRGGGGGPALQHAGGPGEQPGAGGGVGGRVGAG